MGRVDAKAGNAMNEFTAEKLGGYGWLGLPSLVSQWGALPLQRAPG